MKPNNHKTTFDILLAKHGARYVPLTEMGEYFGIQDEQQLRLLALKNQLGGIRAFKLRESRKAPYLVDLENVADELDRKSIAARP